MGDLNQVMFLKKYVPQIDGPVLEVGSKDYGNTSSFREFYNAPEYVGVDLEDGKNVDKVLDLTKGTGDLPQNHFALLICCSVLEHVRRPWLMADYLTSLIRPNGVIYISVPWVWRYHPYPDDFYRYSSRGIAELFPDFRWKKSVYSTNVPGEFFDIGDPPSGIDNKMAVMVDTGSPTQRKHLPYLNVNMLGMKNETSKL